MARYKWGDICKVGTWNFTTFGAYGAQLEKGDTQIGAKLVTDIEGAVVDPRELEWSVEPRYTRKMTKGEWRTSCEEARRDYPDLATGGHYDPDSKRRGAASFDTPSEVVAETLHVIRWLCANRPALFCSAMVGHWNEHYRCHTEWAGRAPDPAEDLAEAEKAKVLSAEWRALQNKCVGMEEEQPPPELTFTTEAGRPCTLSCARLDEPGLMVSVELDAMVITVDSGDGPEERALKQSADRFVVLTPDGRIEEHDLYEVGCQVGLGAADDETVRAYVQEHGAALLALSGARTRNTKRYDDNLRTPDTSGYVRPKGGFRGAS